MSRRLDYMMRERLAREGREARAAGKRFGGCPQYPHEAHRDAWRAGWLEGFELAPAWTAAGWCIESSGLFGTYVLHEGGVMLHIDNYVRLACDERNV